MRKCLNFSVQVKAAFVFGLMREYENSVVLFIGPVFVRIHWGY